MSRRDQTTPQDPDTEIARAERDLVEGQKNTLQTEILGMAKNKKDLEADFEFAKKKLAEEFEKDKMLLQAELSKEEQKLEIIKKNRVEAEAEADRATQEKRQIVDSKNIHFKELENAKSELQSHNEQHNRLIMINRDMQNRISELSPQVVKLLSDKNSLQSEVSSLIEKKNIITKEIEQNTVKLGEINGKYEDICIELVKKTENLTELFNRLDEVKNSLAKANKDLLLIQKQNSDHKQEIQDREGSINERLGNLSRLELRVDGKIDQLKEAKKEFTTEHLARMGIKD